ncbi:peptidase M1 [Nonlabens spongiae]|uniref:Aminopeptidase N n=1 Tax=Nonlabens spongiae TaxID=331648 RepID=A0A1W6MHW8_9FLAO|nr:M1 family metallopeptidase [Nonlabens spongiae]ARN77214.1 peptidase M1 [Nonlabens spongiae]
MKKLIVLTCLCMSTILWAQNSPSQLSHVDFQTASAQVVFKQDVEEVSGTMDFEIAIKSKVDSVFVDAKNLIDYEVRFNGSKADSLRYNGEQLILYAQLDNSSNNQLSIDFTIKPKKALYFIDADQDGKWEQAWTQGQGKYTSNWLPSIDDTSDKMIWNMQISVPKDLIAIANGAKRRFERGEEFDTFSYGMLQPMSSYLVAVAVGEYEFYTEQTENGVTLQYFYYPEERDKAFATYHDTREIFDYLVEEIGVEYPWQVYRQVPVKDFLYSGMENTSTTFFNDQFLVDEIGVNDRDYLNVNAHELAHQWFGNLVTAKSGNDHWLQEGFATYYALMAEREVYGDAYFSMELYQYAEALIELSNKPSKKALTDPVASSLTFYQHGAWALHALKDMIGASRFRESVQLYLQTYAYSNASTDDFIKIVEEVSQKDLTSFRKLWLETPQFPVEESLRLLRKDLFMEAYFQLAARRLDTFEDAQATYKEVLQTPVQEELVKEMVAQLAVHEDDRKYQLLVEASKLKNHKINQLISMSQQEVNAGNREMIEGFLNADSYITRENALYLLWQYASDRKKVLVHADELWESYSPSLRMAWFAMALNTNNFKKSEALEFLTELQKFTSPEYDTQTRTAAFDYLINMNAMSEQNYRDLMEASTHHVWRFYENSRDLLRSLYKKPESKSVINQILLKMDSDQAERFEAILRKSN